MMSASDGSAAMRDSYQTEPEQYEEGCARTEGRWATELGLDWEDGEVPDLADVGDLVERGVVRLKTV